MSLKIKIEDLEELSVVPDVQRTRIIEEYKKGYHFLLFYGKIIVVFVMILALESIDGFVHKLPWFYRFSVYAALGYVIAFLVKIIETNIIAKRVIRDLLKET